MHKTTLPRACLTSRSTRPNFVNNPRPPQDPPHSARNRNLHSTRQREPPKLVQTSDQQNEDENKFLKDSKIPTLLEDPPPKRTPERTRFHKLCDQFFCENEVAAMLDYALDTIDVTDQKTLK